MNQFDEQDQKHGPWEEFHNNGQLWYKGSYEHSKKQGPWEWFYKNGQLCEKGHFENDNCHGPWEGFHESGQVWYKGSYENGVKIGLWEHHKMDKNELKMDKNELKMDKNELKKEFLKTKRMVEFSHYCSGSLYYNVAVENNGIYQFPIVTVENRKDVDTDFTDMDGYPETISMVELSSDLGTTAFNNTERASMLWRWIEMAIDKGEFVKVG